MSAFDQRGQVVGVQHNEGTAPRIVYVLVGRQYQDSGTVIVGVYTRQGKARDAERDAEVARKDQTNPDYVRLWDVDYFTIESSVLTD